MEDYGKFLEEAQQAVLLEEKLRGQETDLKAQTEERQKELAAEEQSLKDSIDRTVTSRRKELAANFDDEIAEERAALKRAQSKKERAKHIGKQERIAAESAPIEEEMAETGRRLRELFRKQQVPGIFRSKLYYALYWPQHFGEWMQIFLFVALLFVALPCGIYFLALPAAYPGAGADLHRGHRPHRRHLHRDRHAVEAPLSRDAERGKTHAERDRGKRTGTPACEAKHSAR